jgi:hypothetical protein
MILSCTVHEEKERNAWRESKHKKQKVLHVVVRMSLLDKHSWSILLWTPNLAQDDVDFEFHHAVQASKQIHNGCRFVEGASWAIPRAKSLALCEERRTTFDGIGPTICAHSINVIHQP